MKIKLSFLINYDMTVAFDNKFGKEKNSETQTLSILSNEMIKLPLVQ